MDVDVDRLRPIVMGKKSGKYRNKCNRQKWVCALRVLYYVMRGQLCSAMTNKHGKSLSKESVEQYLYYLAKQCTTSDTIRHVSVGQVYDKMRYREEQALIHAA